VGLAGFVSVRTISSGKFAVHVELKSVQSWKFPRPMSGAAKGVFTISYQ
jgi:hypothetical protein